jgi:hypothetical protein
MNEAHTNAVLAALEGQRNNALNGLVNTEAALTIARARITELEKALAVVTTMPEPREGTV